MEDCKGHYGVAMGRFLVGSLAGGCAALLLAPATGKRTRERLARKLRDTKESVTDFTDDLADTTRQIAEKASQISVRAITLTTRTSVMSRASGERRCHHSAWRLTAAGRWAAESGMISGGGGATPHYCV